MKPIDEFEQMFSRAMTLQSKGAVGEALAVLQDLARQLEKHHMAERYARVLMNIGLMEAGMGLHQDALHHFTVSMEQFESLGDQINSALARGNIGSCYRDTDRLDDALEWYQSALEMFSEKKHVEGMADQKANIAYALALSGRYIDALRIFKDAHQEYILLHNQIKEQETLKNIIQIEQIIHETAYEGS